MIDSITVTSADIDYSTKFDALSLSSCFLKLMGTGEAGQASGFFWRAGEDVFLITNWHVVTGKHPFTKEFINQGWCPEKIEVRYNVRDVSSEDQIRLFGADAKVFTQRRWTIALDNYANPLWLQHRRCITEGIDIVLIKFDDVSVDRKAIHCVNDIRFAALFHFVGCDLLIVGYPIKETANASLPSVFPISKRGSLASELILPWNSRPHFVVDCRTSKGMSGSPVVRRVFGPATLADLTVNLDSVVTSEFMGVYSGRLHDDEANASLGIVWPRKLIDEIIRCPIAGSRM